MAIPQCNLYIQCNPYDYANNLFFCKNGEYNPEIHMELQKATDKTILKKNDKVEDCNFLQNLLQYYSNRDSMVLP